MPDNSTSRFWGKYIDKTIRYNKSPAISRWYVRHAEEYIRVQHGKRLAQHTTTDIEQYLQDKGRNPRLQDWQFRQIIDALRVLFVDMVQADWAIRFAWDDWSANAATLPTTHTSVARDAQTAADRGGGEPAFPEYSNKVSALFATVSERHPRHVERLIAQIRSRHYSIRTEQTYLAWVLRYIGFHDLSDPAHLDETHISRFLEYLVLRRNVAASTQSQALNALVFFYKNVLERPLSEQIAFPHSKKPRRLPVVLTRDEVQRLFNHFRHPTQRLMANLLY